MGRSIEAIHRASSGWYHRNRDKVCVKRREDYAQNKNNVKEKQKEWYKIHRKKALEILGGKCQFCGGTKRLVFHEKEGKSHSRSRTYRFVLESPDSFVLLCKFPCHKAVHYCMELLGMAWNDVRMFIKKKEEYNG